jgi:ubiquinone/menaquinone biosynthesis C-methylase UbiE
MSSDDRSAALIEHYGSGGLLAAIEAGLASMGTSTDTVTVDDLEAVDEFHVGGRRATTHLLAQLDLTRNDRVLDLGCGIGGPARQAAQSAGRVVGIDLVPEYVEVGAEINRWVGLDQIVELRTGSITDLPFDDGGFDAAYLIHVGMNIADKRALMGRVARTLRPGGRFAVYDVMAFADGDLTHPLPWSSDPATSHLARPEVYQEAAAEAGLMPVVENNRRRQAIEFFDRMAAGRPPSDGSPPLGLHLVMGPTIGEKVANMAAAIRANQIAPVEMLFHKVG